MSLNDVGLKKIGILLAIPLTAAFLILGFSSTVYASRSNIDFYSLSSPPPGTTSLEPLIAKWWNWWEAHPTNIANNWPTCIKEDVGIIGNNQHLVFVANPAYASDKNVNSTNQKCELSSNQL